MGETEGAVTVIVGLVGIAGAYMIGWVARRRARRRRSRTDRPAGAGGYWSGQWWA